MNMGPSHTSRYKRLGLIIALLCLLNGWSVFVNAAIESDDNSPPISSSCVEEGDDETNTCKMIQEQKHPIPQQAPKKHYFPRCRLYLAKSTIPGTNLGLFTSTPLRRGQPIAPPDIIIQLIDYYNSKTDESPSTISKLISDYSWDAQRFGGQFEAKSVASILPGVGSIANAMTDFQSSNALAFGARDFDEANVPRTTSSGAGAFTHYHNVTFYASRDVDAGSEIFVYYAKGEWYRERMERITAKPQSEKLGEDTEDNLETAAGGENTQKIRSVDWLKEHGICVDNLIPGQSKMKHAGRGAFASTFIPEGTIIVASPMVLLDRNETFTKRVKHGGKVRKASKQLLVNYLLGHVDSSLMFLPLSPIVNLINHGTTANLNTSTNEKKARREANTRIQWSSSDQHDGKNWQHLSLEEVKALRSDSSLSASGFMMDYIATRDIQPGEEILMDYGTKWEQAWFDHAKEWKPLQNAKAYSPSYVMDDVAGLVRTEKEQALHPYPSNVMTGCFYRYSNHERNDGIAANMGKPQGEATTVKWKMDRYTFDYDNLRPCSIMQRDEEINNQGQSQVSYTVMMKNWQGMKKEEIIPKGEIHVVNSVPRQAIRFLDKMYSTDQHLVDAFRHEIQIPDDVFPSQWLDLR